MRGATVQAVPGELQRFSLAATASLAPVHDAVGHYRRALLAFQGARNDLRAPDVGDLTAAIGGELDRLTTVDATPGRIAATLLGADAARIGLRSEGPSVPTARPGAIGAVRVSGPAPDGTLLLGADELRRLWSLLTLAPRGVLIDRVLGPFVLPYDVIAGNRRGRDVLGDARTWLGRYGKVAGPLSGVLGLLSVREDWDTTWYGSEHDGLRGVGDRVAAGANLIALAGGGVMLIAGGGAIITATAAGGAAAVASGGAMVAVTAGAVAGAWAIGTLAWDRRRDIARHRLGRAYQRGREAQSAGRGLRSAGDALGRGSALAGAGVQIAGHAIGRRADAATQEAAASRDRLAELQAAVDERVEELREEYVEDAGPVAGAVADHATDLLDEGVARVDGVLHATQLTAAGLAAGSRRLGDAAGHTTRRVGRAAGDTLERSGQAVHGVGTSVRAGVRTVGSWLGLDRTDPGDGPAPSWDTSTCPDVGPARAVDDRPSGPPAAAAVDHGGSR